MILDDNGCPLAPVHTCYNDAEAALVVSYLEAYGIAAQANSEVPHSVLPVTVGALGKIRILVSEDDAEEAKALLAESHPDPLLPEQPEEEEPANVTPNSDSGS